MRICKKLRTCTQQLYRKLQVREIVRLHGQQLSNDLASTNGEMYLHLLVFLIDKSSVDVFPGCLCFRSEVPAANLIYNQLNPIANGSNTRQRASSCVQNV